MLRDRFGRVVTNLRVVVTSRCNLRCFYCHKEGEQSSGKELSAERIAEIAEAFYRLGVKKIKLTGGEPLLRKDILDLISLLPPFEEISMTTNGTLLAEKAYELKECGLDRVNVSLDTLSEDKYRFITGNGELQRVIDGIEAACDAGLTPVKINTIVMRGINDDEIDELLKFTNSFNSKEVKAILQLIELIPSRGLEKYYFDISKLEKDFADIAYEVKVRAMHRRKQYWTPKGIVEFVKPLDNTEFCMHCNRMRITSDGKLKLCLLRDLTVDIDGLHGDELIKVIKEAVNLREPFFKPDPEL